MPQSEIPYLGGFELKLELVRNQGDKLGVCGLSLGVAHSVAEEALQSVQIAPVPGHLDGVADGPLYPGRRGAEGLCHLGVEHLGNGVDGVPDGPPGSLLDAAGEPYKD